MAKVLIAPMTLAALEGEFINALRGAGFELAYPPDAHQLSEDELIAQLNDVSASLAGSEPYTARVLDACPQLRVIARAGVGFDAVDVKAATDRGVAVTITPNTNQDAVAELAFTLILALAKDLIPQHRGLQQCKWPRKANIPLRNRTLGLAGLGRIGKSMAIRGRAFGMKVLAYDLFADTVFAANNNVTIVPTFEQLVRESDYLSLHLPATPETKHLINKTTLGLMKPTAYLLNTARGSLVCEADLHEALVNKRIAGAGLDVFEMEPPGKIPLLELDNVVATPHAAGTDLQSRDDMALSAAQAIVSLSKGEWPAEKIVNPEVRGRFKW